MTLSPIFFLLLLNFAFAEESCFLRSYVNSRTIMVREIPVTISQSQESFTKIIPTHISDPRLKELLDFASSHQIVLVKESSIPSGSTSHFITVTSDILKDEASLLNHLERSLSHHFSVPLNLEKLTPDARQAVLKMQANFKTTFINESDSQGLSYIQKNMIGIKLLHPDDLRVTSVLNHEVTHHTTDRKIFESMDRRKNGAVEPLRASLAGREMGFRAKPAKSLNLPFMIDGYNKYYRSDEIEATLRELARLKKDKLNLDTAKIEIMSFINSQEKQLNAFIENKHELKILNDIIETDQAMYRKQRRIVSTDSSDLNVEILVPWDLSHIGEKEFILKTFEQRLEVLRKYRETIMQKFGA